MGIILFAQIIYNQILGQEMFFQNINMQDGLRTKTVYSCTDIHNDKIFLNTDIGIFSYDGYKIREESINKRLIDKETFIAKSYNKNSIVFTNSINTIYFYDEIKQHLEPYYKIKDDCKSDWISNLSIDEEKNIWLCTNFEKIYILNKNKELFIYNLGTNEKIYSEVYFMAKKNICLVGQNIIEIANNSFKIIKTKNVNYNESVNIYKINNNIILYKKDKQLSLINVNSCEEKEIQTNIPIDEIIRVKPISNSHGYLCTSHKLYKYRISNQVLMLDHLKTFPLINSISVLSNNMVIVCTATNGLYMGRNIKSSELYSCQNNNELLKSVTYIDSNIFIGQNEGKSIMINPRRKKIQQLKSNLLYTFGQGRIFKIHKIKNDHLGFLLEQKYFITKGRNITHIFPFGIKDILETKNNYVFGTSRDLHICPKDSIFNFSIGLEEKDSIIYTKTPTNIEKYSFMPWIRTLSIDQDNKNNIFISTNKGLYYINTNKMILDSLKTSNNSQKTIYNKIASFSNDIIIAASQDNEVEVINISKNQTYKLILVPKPAKINNIRKINDNTGFVCSDIGLYKVEIPNNPNTPPSYSFYDKKDGILSKDVQDIAWDENSFCIIGEKTATIIEPKSFLDEIESAPVVTISDIKINNSKFTGRKILTKQDNIELDLELSANSLNNHGNIIFRIKQYKNPGWILSYSPNIKLKLDYGSNFIEIQAKTPYSPWSKSLTIGPFFIEKTMTYNEIIGLKLIENKFSIIFFIFSVILFILYKKNETKKELLKLKIRNINSIINPHIFTNFLYDFQYKFSNRDYITGTRVFNKSSLFIRKIINRENEDFTTLEKELGLIEEYIEIENLKKDWKIDLKTIYYPNNEKFIFQANESKIPSMIIFSLVENSITHGLKGLTNNPKIRINIKLIREHNENNKKIKTILLIEVIDNGKGLSSTQNISKSRGFGEQITFTRLKLYKELYKRNIKLSTKNQSGEEGGVISQLWIPLD